MSRLEKLMKNREKTQQVLTKITGYMALLTLILGDYLFANNFVSLTPSWIAWLALALLTVISAGYLLFQTDWKRVFKQIPIELILLLALMIGGAAWSAYPSTTAISFAIQVGVTTLALFFVASFSWRQIIEIFSTALRVIIFSSILIDLAASVAKEYIGNFLPASMPELHQALNSHSHLFDGGRAVGILGNANYTAAWAVIGVITFAIEIVIQRPRRMLSLISLSASLAIFAGTKSAGMIFATVAVVLAAIVSLLAEGKDRQTRHIYYRAAWTVAGIAGFLVLVFRGSVFEFLGKSPDMTHRSYIWRKVFTFISQRPLEGWGFSGVWDPNTKPFGNLIVINGTRYFQAHNTYLDLWLQLGLVGLGLFLILIVRTFIKTWRLGVHHSNALYLWPLLLLITQLVRGITESRLLIQSAMFMLILFAVKSYDPEDLLEVKLNTTKMNQLEKLRLRKAKSR